MRKTSKMSIGRSSRTVGDDRMIRDFKNLKERGVEEFRCMTYVEDRVYKSVWRRTARGVTAYVNRMFQKYGDGAEVRVDYFDPKSGPTIYWWYSRERKEDHV